MAEHTPEAKTVRDYHVGDTFYVPAEVADRQGFSFLQGVDSVIVLGIPSVIDEGTYLRVKYVFTDRRTLDSAIPISALHMCSQDRRYGRQLTDLTTERMSGINADTFNQSIERPSQIAFRKTDTFGDITSLRLTASLALKKVGGGL